jgi:mgtE-like transporter
MRGTFGRIDGLLVLLPALLATRGNVYGTLGARVATGLHQGLLEPRVREESARLGVLVAAALTTGLLASALAALLAALATAWLPLPPASFPTLLAVALLSGALSGVVLAAVVVGVAIVGYRNGQNPDTLVGPVVTTTGDVVGVAFLFVATEIVLLAGGG